jgi:2-haloacid dehalogenase
MNIWRTRQFEYTWLRSMTKHYENFEKVTADALVYATAFLGLPYLNNINTIF